MNKKTYPVKQEKWANMYLPQLVPHFESVSVEIKFIIKPKKPTFSVKIQQRKTLYSPLSCSQFTKQNIIFTFILFTIHKPRFFAETDAASGINVVNSSSKSGWPSKRTEIWNCKAKTSKNTDSYINEKKFPKQEQWNKQNHSIYLPHCRPYLRLCAPSCTYSNSLRMLYKHVHHFESVSVGTKVTIKPQRTNICS